MIDIWQAMYMNALLLVGLEFIETYVNKCFRIPNDWSEFKNKLRKTFCERSEQKILGKFALF